MNTTELSTTTTSEPSARPRSRRGRYLLAGLVIFAATIALFYAEEDWRGRRAWENCQRELKTKGANLDWSSYMAPPVPENQNVFGVPQMREWFVRPHQNEFETSRIFTVSNSLSKALSYPGWDKTNRIVVAIVTIGLPGTTPPNGFNVLRWAEGNQAKAEAARLIKETLGPMAMDPISRAIMAKNPANVRPAEIFLQCQTAPTATELADFLPKDLSPKLGWSQGFEKVQLESAGNNSYRATMLTPLSAADYVAWGEKIPELAIVRQAVQRPYSRIEGNDGDLVFGPAVNFVVCRYIVQRLGAFAECYMLLGQPEKALDALTFMHQVRRILEFRPSGKPMPLVTAMINVAVVGLYAETIEDGLRLNVWSDSQLAALQRQLKEINLRPYVEGSLPFERAMVIHLAETTPRKDLGKLLWPGSGEDTNFWRRQVTRWLPRLVPQGWIDQNLVVFANLEQKIIGAWPKEGDEIVPHQIAPASEAVAAISHNSPFNMVSTVATPNFIRAATVSTHNQTLALQAQIVCALERYHLAHGEYPPTLEALTPQYIEKIPRDLIGGQPPHYHRTDDGKFVLYSIGWTEKDHGGKSASQVWEGDWVWGTD